MRILALVLSMICLMGAVNADKDEVDRIEIAGESLNEIIIKPLNISETLIYDKSGLEIRVTNSELDEESNICINTCIKNKDEHNFKIRIDKVYVNGFEIKPFFNDKCVASGEIVDNTLAILGYDLRLHGISEISNLRIYMNITEIGYNGTIISENLEIVDINTNEYADKLENFESEQSKIIYNSDNLEVYLVGVYLGEDSLASDTVLKIKNTGETDKQVNISNVNVNGHNTDIDVHTKIGYSETRIVLIHIDDETFKQHKIDRLTDLEFDINKECSVDVKIKEIW